MPPIPSHLPGVFLPPAEAARRGAVQRHRLERLHHARQRVWFCFASAVAVLNWLALASVCVCFVVASARCWRQANLCKTLPNWPHPDSQPPLPRPPSRRAPSWPPPLPSGVPKNAASAISVSWPAITWYLAREGTGPPANLRADHRHRVPGPRPVAFRVAARLPRRRLGNRLRETDPSRRGADAPGGAARAGSGHAALGGPAVPETRNPRTN